MPKTRKPRRLQAGDHVRIVSLSAPDAVAFPRRLERAEAELERLGFRVTTAACVGRSVNYMAGSPQERAADFTEAWNDPEVDAIVSAVGGTATQQVLEHIDFESLGDPKVLVGYSDFTALQIALLAKRDFVSFVGPAALPQWGAPDGINAYALRSFLDATSSLAHPRSVALPEQLAIPPDWSVAEATPLTPTRLVSPRTQPRILKSGLARGTLVVANLGVLSLLVGTAYFPDLRGAILVVEDDESERIWSIDRLFVHLRQSAALAGIEALIVSEFPAACEMEGAWIDDAVERATRGYPYPVVVDFPFGHVDPSPTLPVGVLAELDATVTHAPTLSLLEAAVR